MKQHWSKSCTKIRQIFRSSRAAESTEWTEIESADKRYSSLFWRDVFSLCRAYTSL